MLDLTIRPSERNTLGFYLVPQAPDEYVVEVAGASVLLVKEITDVDLLPLPCLNDSDVSV